MGGGVCGASSECSKRSSSANFVIVFDSNYGSALLSFRDMTMGETVDGRRTDRHAWQASNI